MRPKSHRTLLETALVLGRYEFERRRRTELDPIEGLQLSDLLKITKKTPGLVGSLGLSTSQWDKMTGPIVKTRHATMHPVRALIRSYDDVPKLVRKLEDMRKLIEKVEAAILQV
jgi:hypothetical protein